MDRRDMDVSIGDTMSVDEVNNSTYTKQEFYRNWKSAMNKKPNQWVVLEIDDDLELAGNRFSSRATRMRAYTWTNGYTFKAVRRKPYAYFLGMYTGE